jgi:hypothetical protein
MSDGAKFIFCIVFAAFIGGIFYDPSNKILLLVGLSIVLPATGVYGVYTFQKRDRSKEKERILARLLPSLEKRIGRIDLAIIKQIRKLPVNQLEELSDRAINFNWIEDLTRWLDKKCLK